MTTTPCRLFMALLCLCLNHHQSIAFQPPASSVLAASSRSASASRGCSSGVPHAAASDECDGPDSGISRRNIIGRTLSGVSLVVAASLSNVERGNAIDVPSFLMSSEGDRGVKGMPVPGKKLGGLSNKIRSVSKIMDELQRDLMQERWDLVEGYPNQLRSYVPVFTAYTDSAFPTDIPTDKGLRVALRYEVGRFFGSLERFRQAANRKSLDEAYVAYSDMSLHFDRYLRVGGLYTFYDDNVSLEPYYKGVADTSLIFADPKKDPALVRDLVILISGPEKGRTGIMIGIYPDGSNTCAVKLDRSRGIREIRVVPLSWAAKRLGEQDPDDVFLIPPRPQSA